MKQKQNTIQKKRDDANLKNNQIEYLGGKCDHDIKTQD